VVTRKSSPKALSSAKKPAPVDRAAVSVGKSSRRGQLITKRSGEMLDTFSVGGPGRRISMPYEAASFNPQLPRVANLGPSAHCQFNPTLQRLARQSNRNDGWLRRAIQFRSDAVVSTGPTPRTEFPELDELFVRWAKRADVRGVHSFGTWLKDDLYKTSIIDGEIFLKKVQSSNSLMKNRVLPLQFLSMTSDYVPIGYTTIHDGNRIVSGIEIDDDESRVAIWCYNSNPLEPYLAANGLIPTRTDVADISHLFSTAMPGSPRGEVILAAALIRAYKLQTYEDAELKRKLAATLFSGFISETLEADGQNLPSEEELDEFFSQVALEAGALVKLPAGMTVNFSEPADTPASYEWYIKRAIQYVCAVLGVPAYAITSDYSDLNDRIMKTASLELMRLVDSERERIEHQILNWVWEQFVDTAIATGLWSPPTDGALYKAYDPEWDWPVVQAAQLNQELAAMISAVNAGIIDAPTVSRTYFGARSERVQRRQAEFQARANVLGLSYNTSVGFVPEAVVGQQIVQSVAEEEATVRQEIDAASVGALSQDPNPD